MEDSPDHDIWKEWFRRNGSKNPKGGVLFEGPIGTEEQRRALPAGILERLEKNVPHLFRMPVTLPFDLAGGDPGC